jgi:hypothetical protein
MLIIKSNALFSKLIQQFKDSYYYYYYYYLFKNFNSVLLTEVTDNQLKRLSKDKSVALKMIESQTG